MMKNFTTSIVFTFFSFLLQAQEQLSLANAVETAINNAYTVKSANAQLNIAEIGNNWGEAGRMPTINSSINNASNYSSIQNPTSFLNGANVISSNTTLALDLQWVLYDGGRIKLNKNRLSVLQEQSKNDLLQVTDNIVLSVSKSYFNVLVQEKRFKLLAELLNRSREKISYLEARKEFGQATEFDLLQVKDAYLNDSIQWVIQKNNYETALQNLALSMGLEVNAEFNYRLMDTLDYSIGNYTFENQLNELKNNNKQLRIEKVKIKLSELEIDLQKTNLRPKFVFGANISEQANLSKVDGKEPLIPNSLRGGATFTANISLGLNYTIYNGGKFKRGIEIAKIRKEISEYSSSDLERRLSQQLKIAFNQLNNQKSIFSLSQEMLKNANKNLLIAEERFRAGTLNYFDFRTIQINSIRSINTLQDAFLNAKNTELDILFQSGTLFKRAE